MSIELRMTRDGRIESTLGEISPGFDGNQPPPLVIIATDAVTILADQPLTDNGLTTTITTAEDHTYLHLAGPVKKWSWELQPAHWADPDDKPEVMIGQLVA